MWQQMSQSMRVRPRLRQRSLPMGRASWTVMYRAWAVKKPRVGSGWEAAQMAARMVEVVWSAVGVRRWAREEDVEEGARSGLRVRGRTRR